MGFRPVAAPGLAATGGRFPGVEGPPGRPMGDIGEREPTGRIGVPIIHSVYSRDCKAYTRRTFRFKRLSLPAGPSRVAHRSFVIPLIGGKIARLEKPRSTSFEAATRPVALPGPPFFRPLGRRPFISSPAVPKRGGSLILLTFFSRNPL